ncbi:MAG: DUF2182 domain-containing protein [Acidobacteria bacterium]|nr:DUF2182 domain-containing protein [Acidobacteriota bacterium]
MLALSEGRKKAAVLAAFIALSWVTLWAWGQTDYGQHLNHAAMGSAIFAEGLRSIAFFVIGWTLMTVAMMLPTSLPLLGMFETIVSSRTYPAALVATCVFGYLSIWVLFGFAAHFGVAALYDAIDNASFRPILLLAAGVYQFTPLKYYCLKKCRSPFSFINAHWHGRNEWLESFWLGAHHGLFCIGCCWSLMLLMFLAVTAHTTWMLALGTVMAIEKNARWGKHISTPLGIALIASAVLIWIRY